MSDIIDIRTYRQEIESLARQCVEEARDYKCDLSTVIHETVDGHQWIIYNRYNLAVLQCTDNEDAAEEMGGLSSVLRERGVSGLLAYLACAAMIRDVEDRAAALAEELEDEDSDEDLDEDLAQ